MTTSFSRRSFLSTASTSLSLAGTCPLIAALGSVPDEQARARPGIVQLRPEIEPLVRLIEETSRDRLMEEIGSRIRQGLGYQELLAALLLAGVRNVEPRPAVGFKFHAVLVVNSAHLASIASPDSDRWLPILWAIDEFKSSQARDVAEGNWTMSPVDEAQVPQADSVRHVFQQAMQAWDEPKADVAAAGIARFLGAAEVLELFASFAARDFRSIGHKAIYLANAWRALQTIGWEHAEPVLRSLAYAVLNHVGEPNPASSDLVPDRSWKHNHQLISAIRPGWESGRQDSGATAELLSLLRTGSAPDASALVTRQLQNGISPQSVYDAIHLASGELLMRQPGIVSLHATTTTNALRFLFENVSTPQTRLLLLLQNAAFLPQFRDAMAARGQVGDVRIDQLVAAEPAESISVDRIFETVGREPLQAAQQALSFLDSSQNARPLMDAARRLIFLKGTDSHDYKFSTAVLEDYYRISPDHRSRFLAASTYHLKGAGAADNQLVDRIRGALG